MGKGWLGVWRGVVEGFRDRLASWFVKMKMYRADVKLSFFTIWVQRLEMQFYHSNFDWIGNHCHSNYY